MNALRQSNILRFESLTVESFIARIHLEVPFVWDALYKDPDFVSSVFGDLASF